MKKLLFGLLGILFLGTSWSATLPAGYTELEYIESTGTQWIDTGIIRGRFVHDIVFTERTQNNLMGGSTAGGLYWGQTRSHISSNDGYELGPNHIDVDTSVRRIIEYSNISSPAKLTTGNTTITYSISTPSNTYTIFKIHNSEQYYTKTKLYGLKVYTTDDNTSLVRNFVPAKNSSGVVGMYDTVNDVFYTNQGTGTFTAGPLVGIHIATTAYNNAQFNPVVTDLNSTIATIRDVVTNTINQTKAIADLQAKKQTRPDEQCPAGKKCLLVETEENGIIVPHWYEIIENVSSLPSGYTELEYITKNSLAYIDSGIKQTNSVGISIDVKFDSYNTGTTYQYALGAYNSGDYIGVWKPDNSRVSLCFVSSIVSVSSSDNTNFHNFKINYLNSRNFSYDNSKVGDITQTKGATAPNIYIGDTNYSQHFGGSSFSIKRVRISNETAIVFDGIPAKTTINGTEVVGLYDTVSETFKTATSGTFTAGPEI